MSTTIQILPPAELQEIDFSTLQAIAAIPEDERYAHAASMDLPTLGRFIQPAVNCAEALVAAYRPYLINFRERTAHQGEQKLLTDGSGKSVTRDELCRQTIGVGIRRLNQLLKVTDPDAQREEDSPKPKPTKKTGHAREGEFSVEKLEGIYLNHPEVDHYIYARREADRWLSGKFGKLEVGDFNGEAIEAFMRLWDAYGRPLNINIDETYFDWAWKELGFKKKDEPTMTVAEFIEQVIELEEKIAELQKSTAAKNAICDEMDRQSGREPEPDPTPEHIEEAKALIDSESAAPTVTPEPAVQPKRKRKTHRWLIEDLGVTLCGRHMWDTHFTDGRVWQKATPNLQIAERGVMPTCQQCVNHNDGRGTALGTHVASDVRKEQEAAKPTVTPERKREARSAIKLLEKKIRDDMRWLADSHITATENNDGSFEQVQRKIAHYRQRIEKLTATVTQGEN